MKSTEKVRRPKGRHVAVTAGVLAAGLLTSMMAPAFAQDAVPAPLAAGGSYAEQVLATPGDKATVPNQAWYRIPALADLGGGVVLAAYDGRPDGGDSPSPNSIVQRRSIDGGKTWGAPTFVARGQVGSRGVLQYGFSDPSYVVDKVTGNVFAFFVYSKDQGFHGSTFSSDDADRQMVSAAVAVSTDKGLTWSMDPGNMPTLPVAPNYAAGSKYAGFDGPLVSDVAKPAGGANNIGGVAGLFAASGEGIQLQYGEHKGRLIQQFTGKVKQADGSTPFQSYSVYSDDHGKTWQRGAFVGTGMDENKTVELSNGDVMMNSRASSGGNGGRKVAISKDGGQTYGPVTINTELRDPVNNASIARMYPNAVQGSAEAKILLFSNANATTRSNGTIRYSCDDGATWSAGKQFKDGYMAYSTVTALSDGTFGLLYEGNSNAITFGKFDADWLGVDCIGTMNAALAAANVSGANGATVDVPLTVTNNGSGALSGAVASFTGKPGWTFAPVVVPNVAPGATATINVPVTIPATLKAGNVTLQATLAQGTQKVTANAVVAVTGGATANVAALEVSGFLRAPVRDIATSPYAVGDKVGYDFRVDNVGNIAVEVRPTKGNFQPLRRVSEGGTSDSGNCGYGSVAVGTGYTCTTAQHTVADGELADGFFVPATEWRATGSGLTSFTPVTGAEVDLLVRKPSLSATHTGAALVDVDSSGFATVGDTISYTSVITNTGNVRLADVTVAGQPAFELAAGEGKTITSVYTLTAADVAANKVVKGLSVTARNGAKLAGASVSAAPVAACSDALCGQAPPMANLIPQNQLSIASVSSEELTGETAPSGPAAALLDGDYNTFWHSKWSGTAGAYPFSVVFDLGKGYSVTGLEYTQRQNAANGKMKDYEIFVSNSPTEFGEKVSSGAFADSKDPQRIAIAGNKAGRYVKLVGLNGIANNAFGGGSEVNIGGLPVTAGTATVSASPGSVEAGKDISVTLGGFAANTAVALSLDGGISLGSATTDAAGNATKSVTVPAGTAAKSYALTATAGAQRATATLVVSAPAPVLGATIKGSRADAAKDLATSPYAVGEQLPYNFVVKSTSNAISTIYPTAGEFAGFNIDGTPNCRYRNVPALGGYTCTTAKRVVTADDVANGYFVPVTKWSAEASGSATVNYTITGDEVDVLVRKPSLAVAVAAGVLEDKDSSGFASVGDVVSFPVTVKNDGNVALTAVSVPGVAGAATTLAAGASTSGTVKHTVVAADLAAAKVDGPAVAAAAKNGVKDVAKTGSGAAFALTLAPEPTPSATPSATATPTTEPTTEPTVGPTTEPTATPTVQPTVEPTTEPTTEPTVEPTSTQEPTVAPTTAAPGKPSASLEDASVVSGGELVITGKNFKPGTTATFTLHSDPVVLGSAVVGADGSVSLTVKVPAGVPAGAHTVVISGTGTDGAPIEASIAVKIAAAGSSAPATPAGSSAATTASAGNGDLANTGFGAMPLGIAGGLLVLFGALFAVRRSSARGARH
ncbi:DUF7507 domain-containing protein [Arthrobacter sp. HY1533]|uniref:DUF7507 domain-containing protein n=1 Tax=Arthrobacter sp. HY1533 TaxID=2970919 RepID=UPI0022B9D611|nr:discoidin domain-containing protein [Arthrobacter sp. HY1533]